MVLLAVNTQLATLQSLFDGSIVKDLFDLLFTIDNSPFTIPIHNQGASIRQETQYFEVTCLGKFLLSSNSQG